jgi:hypothetical protein
LKLLAVAAVGAVVAAVGLTIWDARVRADRASAFAEMKQAADRGDEQAARAAADRVLAARPFGGPDAQQAEAERLRAELSDWQNRRIRDATFAQLQQAASSADHEAVLQAAERFLEAPPQQGQDPRREQVLKRYREAFTSWFVGLTGDLDDDARRRIERYRALDHEP